MTGPYPDPTPREGGGWTFWDAPRPVQVVVLLGEQWTDENGDFMGRDVDGNIWRNRGETGSEWIMDESVCPYDCDHCRS